MLHRWALNNNSIARLPSPLRCGPLVLVLLISGLNMMEANAQRRALERLVMPGPVHATHADIEEECSSCHALFERDSQDALCLDCHDYIAADIEADAGFHGMSTDVAAVDNCAECHAEHLGRDADVLGIDVNAFNHDITNFPLIGSHVEVVCEDCHAIADTYHAAETVCYACHVEDDQHLGNLGEDCADCHSEVSWEETDFDHFENSEYSLTGAHAAISCVSCHVDEIYEETPNTCIGCHQEDDDESHMGRNGTECQDCHVTDNWTDLLFDHFERSGFALTGSHSGQTCEACHEDTTAAQDASPECNSCHADDDSHEGVNGTECADCHRPTEWLEVSFNHEIDADFALNGKHADLTCNSCHLENVEVSRPETACFGCHEDDEPHENQLGTDCASCHNEAGFDVDVRFDHDLTQFPLLGLHSDAECEDCHETPAFHDAEELCVNCHVEDDVLEQRLGLDCGLCHSPSAWERWIFDHNAQTNFSLEGAHVGLDCHGCHRQPVDGAIELSMACGSCHSSDDVHRGEFGDDCVQCHTSESFEVLRDQL